MRMKGLEKPKFDRLRMYLLFYVCMLFCAGVANAITKILVANED
jgi:hypothetical protein